MQWATSAILCEWNPRISRLQAPPTNVQNAVRGALAGHTNTKHERVSINVRHGYDRGSMCQSLRHNVRLGTNASVRSLPVDVDR